MSTMPIIKSISSIRSRTREIAAICHDKNQPVFLTKKGKIELVVVSIEHYDGLLARAHLFEKLGFAQAQQAAGEQGITHEQMMARLRKRLEARPAPFSKTSGRARRPLSNS